MPDLIALREQRASKLDALKAIAAKAETETRDMNADESSAFDAGRAAVEKLDREVRNAEFLADAERRADATPLTGGGQGGPDLSGYSLAKASQEALSGREPTGLEGECHQELSRGRRSRGFMVPTSILMETRAIKTTTPGAGPGGNLIGRDILPVTDHPRPALLVEQMGATVMRDLVGDVDAPRLAESGTVGWVAEHMPVPRSDPKFAKASMSPKTVGGEYEVSRRMILQTANAIEELLRRDLGSLLRGALDRAAIAGAGGTQPTGILNTVGISTVTASADLSDTAADLIAELEMDDLTGSRGFLTNPGAMRAIRKIKATDGKVIPSADLFHGERVEITTQVPGAYGAVDADPGGNALIYGQWSELLVGYWSGVDILINPYHIDVASKGGVLIHAFLDADVTVRTPAAFAVARL